VGGRPAAGLPGSTRRARGQARRRVRGYGIVIGPHATTGQLEEARAAIESDPRNWIVQEVVRLSSLPSLCDDRLEGRHLDLRPFVLTGETTQVFPGGLTRVAMRRGSLIVNSSQGVGSKDTWVLARSDDAGEPS
jgi:uncharacterized circularly permuted ATP-grasp superfamily protein